MKDIFTHLLVAIGTVFLTFAYMIRHFEVKIREST